MHVQVHDRLARRLARVEADVVAVGTELRVELALDVFYESEDGGALLVTRGEPVGNDAARDDEGVSGRDGVAIAKGERMGVLGDPVRGRDGEEDGHSGGR